MTNEAACRGGVLSAGRPCGLVRGSQAGLKVACGLSRFGGTPGTFFHHKAALGECIAHRAGDGPGGQARAPVAAARHGLEGNGAPEVGVGLRAEAVEVDRVHVPVLLAQRGLCVANAQREQHAPAVEPQAVHAGQQAPVLRVQFLRQRQRSGWRWAAARSRVGGGHRPGFKRDEMQQRGAIRVSARRPGDEKFSPKPKPVSRMRHCGARAEPAAGRSRCRKTSRACVMPPCSLW